MSSSQAPPKESFVDVLIIGAGPAGVMCANALQQAGVRVRIVDKTCVFLPSSRAPQTSRKGRAGPRTRT